MYAYVIDLLRALPTPITWPLFRFLAVFLPTALPLPRFLPALLTLVTPFHSLSAGTVKSKMHFLKEN